MKTTLKEIRKHLPCDDGMSKLMNGLGYKCSSKTWLKVYSKLTNKIKNKPIDFKFILKNNGIKDTFWALCTQPEKTQMLIGADVAESVLHIYEKECPDDTRIRDLINGIRNYCNGKITKEDLIELKKAAHAAYAVYAVDAADAAVAYAVYAVYAVDAAVDAAAAAVDAAAAAYAVATAYARKGQWQKNQQILEKYL